MPVDLSLERPIDFIIFGLGNSGNQFTNSRQNAGLIFIDYYANCVSLQTHLIVAVDNLRQEKILNPKKKNKTVNGKELTDEEQVLSELTDPVTGVPKYEIPRFTRSLDCNADIQDVIFALSEDAKEVGGKKVGPDPPIQTFRLLLVRGLSSMNESGYIIQKVLQKFPLANQSKQLVIVHDDMNVMRGSINISDNNDKKKDKSVHNGVDSVVKVLGNNDFLRFKLGIGKPNNDSAKTDDYVLGEFMPDEKEMDMLGYTLDLSAQALQLLSSTGDLVKTKKKFASSKKLPTNLRKMQGLQFPTLLK